MIVLDTNVISELMRPEPHRGVFAWVAAQPRRTLYTTSINQAEILYGIECLPAGRRRDALGAAARVIFAEDFADQVLSVDGKAAAHYAQIVAARRLTGNPLEGFHALIAAAALAAGASVATRDVSGFAGCGVGIIIPWEAT
jgi:predicted nucleic acid-binding protein